MRPAVRLAALMRLPVTYVWTHDSIGLGEDGPTHQPIEHLAALRAIPGLDVVRPGDANETAAAWAAILEHTDRPAGLALTRQNVPTFPRGTDGFATTENVKKGGYVLLDTDGTPDVVLIGTGSELQLAVEARNTLAAEGIKARVVSMVSREWFDEQDDAYRESVIPADGPGPGLGRGRDRAGLARHRRRRRPHGQPGALRRVAPPTRPCTTSSASPPRPSSRPPRTASPPPPAISGPGRAARARRRRPGRTRPTPPTDDTHNRTFGRLRT